MYAPLFASMYHGTMSGRSDLLLVFPCLLAHADKHGNVDLHPRSIASMTGLDEASVKKALEDLESDDKESRSVDERYGGKRIVRVDEHRSWGWFIVNYARYQALLKTGTVREQGRLRQQAKRERDGAPPTPDGSGSPLHRKVERAVVAPFRDTPPVPPEIEDEVAEMSAHMQEYEDVAREETPKERYERTVLKIRK